MVVYVSMIDCFYTLVVRRAKGAKVCLEPLCWFPVASSEDGIFVTST